MLRANPGGSAVFRSGSRGGVPEFTVAEVGGLLAGCSTAARAAFLYRWLGFDSEYEHLLHALWEWAMRDVRLPGSDFVELEGPELAGLVQLVVAEERLPEWQRTIGLRARSMEVSPSTWRRKYRRPFARLSVQVDIWVSQAFANIARQYFRAAEHEVE